MTKQTNQTLAEIREERTKTHGDFADGARVFEQLVTPVTLALYEKQITGRQHYALVMAMSKITRILVGNPNEKDHWLDAANYLLLGGRVDEGN